MPRGTMTPPKDARLRRGHAPLAHPDIPLTRDNTLRGPSLEEITARTVWMPATRKWWDVWRRSPQAAVFEETDWQRLSMVARIHDAYVAKPSKALLEEIRMNESLLGATAADRQRLRMKIEAPSDPSSAEGEGSGVVTSIADRRRR